MNNALLVTDSYKLGHAEQYPKGTELVVSNFTPRSLNHSPIGYNHKIVVHGIHTAISSLHEMWHDNFFNRDKTEVIHEFMQYTKNFRPANFDVSRLEALHDLQYLPIHVRALEEGTKVDVKTPVFTIHNTLPEFYWITNYLETSLSALVWKPMTVATIAHEYRKIIDSYSEKTGAASWFSDYQCHDFSSRGLSNLQDIETTGTAHLMSFKGTDSLPALAYIGKYYNVSTASDIAASVPATEHSVMCMGGETDELGMFERLITEVYPEGIVSIVSDTWDYFKVTSEYAESLKPAIMKRDGKVVFRPDSGNPVDIICGTAIPVSTRCDIDVFIDQVYYVVDEDCYVQPLCSERGGAKIFREFTSIDPTNEMRGSVQILHDIFGGTVTDKGYKTLDSHVGLIYGDSITLARCEEILSRLDIMGFASDNIVFGVGSYSYQYITRDTFGFAMKATYGVVNGVGKNIFKNPKTDSGVKKSLKGLVHVDDTLTVTDGVTMEQFRDVTNMLRCIYVDGSLSCNPVFDEVKARILQG